MEYRTEDGKVVQTGDRVYNYYDMKPGVIGQDCGCDYPFRDLPDPNKKRWFRFKADGGGPNILNGERICTMEYAKRRGFEGA